MKLLLPKLARSTLKVEAAFCPKSISHRVEPEAAGASGVTATGTIRVVREIGGASEETRTPSGACGATEVTLLHGFVVFCEGSTYDGNCQCGVSSAAS